MDDTPTVISFSGAKGKAGFFDKSAPDIVRVMWADFGGPEVLEAEYRSKIESIRALIEDGVAKWTQLYSAFSGCWNTS